VENENYEQNAAKQSNPMTQKKMI